MNLKSPMLTDESGSAGIVDLSLPEGFEIAELGGKGGGTLYAVYSEGRRVASGMTNPQSALRWARLMAGVRTSSVAHEAGSAISMAGAALPNSAAPCDTRIPFPGGHGWE